MEVSKPATNSESDSDSGDDLESLLTTPTFPWELSDSDNDYENEWNEGEVCGSLFIIHIIRKMKPEKYFAMSSNPCLPIPNSQADPSLISLCPENR